MRVESDGEQLPEQSILISSFHSSFSPHQKKRLLLYRSLAQMAKGPSDWIFVYATRGKLQSLSHLRPRAKTEGCFLLALCNASGEIVQFGENACMWFPRRQLFDLPPSMLAAAGAL